MLDFVASTMTICSQWVGDERAHEKLGRVINEIPVTSDGLGISRSSKQSDDKLYLSTGIEWRGTPITVALRRTCSRGMKGSGEVVRGNFKNCVQLSCNRQGAKIFKSGAVSAYGFKDIESFHDYMLKALTLFEGSMRIQSDATRIALAIYDSNLKNEKPLHLRAFAQQCVARSQTGEDVEFSPDEFAGLKIKVPHPVEANCKVSVTVRAKGSVKVYVGRPGADYERAVGVVCERVERLLGVHVTNAS